jgi:hypothetical protein
MRGFAVLLPMLPDFRLYIGFGMMGLAALNKPTPSAAPVAAGSQKERLVADQANDSCSKRLHNRVRRRAHVARSGKKTKRRPSHQALARTGYARESRRFLSLPSLFFSR